MLLTNSYKSISIFFTSKNELISRSHTIVIYHVVLFKVIEKRLSPFKILIKLNYKQTINMIKARKFVFFYKS
jgi:hypothetical protein